MTPKCLVGRWVEGNLDPEIPAWYTGGHCFIKRTGGGVRH